MNGCAAEVSATYNGKYYYILFALRCLLFILLGALTVFTVKSGTDRKTVLVQAVLLLLPGIYSCLLLSGIHIPQMFLRYIPETVAVGCTLSGCFLAKLFSKPKKS